MSELQCNIRKQRDDGDMHERVMGLLAVLVWVCDGDSASKWWCEWVIVRVSDVWWCEWVMVWVCVGVSEWWCECVLVWVCVGVSEWWCECVLVWVSDGVNEWCVMVWVSVGLLVNRECMTLHDRNIMIVLFIARLRKQKWISFLQEIPYQNNGEVMSFISQGKHTAPSCRVWIAPTTAIYHHHSVPLTPQPYTHSWHSITYRNITSNTTLSYHCHSLTPTHILISHHHSLTPSHITHTITHSHHTHSHHTHSYHTAHTNHITRSCITHSTIITHSHYHSLTPSLTRTITITHSYQHC